MYAYVCEYIYIYCTPFGTPPARLRAQIWVHVGVYRSLFVVNRDEIIWYMGMGWPNWKYRFLNENIRFGFIGLHFRYRVTIHRRHWPYAKNMRFLEWYIVILSSETDKNHHFASQIEQIWWVRRAPGAKLGSQSRSMGPWGPSIGPLWPRMGSKCAPNGANEGQGGPGYGPQEPKMSQKGPNITLLVAKNGQRGHQKGG